MWKCSCFCLLSFTTNPDNSFRYIRWFATYRYILLEITISFAYIRFSMKLEINSNNISLYVLVHFVDAEYLYICRRINIERNLMRKKNGMNSRGKQHKTKISPIHLCVCVDLFDFGSNDYKHKFAMSIRHWFQQILNSFRFCMHLKPTICSFGCVRYTRIGGWKIVSSIVPLSNNAYSLWPYIHWSGTIGLAIQLKSLFMFQVTITIRNQHFRPTKKSVFSFLFVEEIAHWRENPSVEVVRQAVFLTHCLFLFFGSFRTHPY